MTKPHSDFSSYHTCPECGSVHRRLRLDVRRTDYRFEDRCQSEWHRAVGESREEFSDYLVAQDTLYQTAQRLASTTERETKPDKVQCERSL